MPGGPTTPTSSQALVVRRPLEGTNEHTHADRGGAPLDLAEEVQPDLVLLDAVLRWLGEEVELKAQRIPGRANSHEASSKGSRSP
jgi:hypothetical protein